LVYKRISGAAEKAETGEENVEKTQDTTKRCRISQGTKENRGNDHRSKAELVGKEVNKLKTASQAEK